MENRTNVHETVVNILAERLIEAAEEELRRACPSRGYGECHPPCARCNALECLDDALFFLRRAQQGIDEKERDLGAPMAAFGEDMPF